MTEGRGFWGVGGQAYELALGERKNEAAVKQKIPKQLTYNYHHNQNE